MIFEITGSLLERVVELSIKLGISLPEAAARALEEGSEKLTHGLELTPVTEQVSRRAQPWTMEKFIREHWQTMSDAEMARRLGYQPRTVILKRYAFGLKRRKGSRSVERKDKSVTGGTAETETSSGNHYLPSALTPEQKQLVAEKLPTMKLRVIAVELNVPLFEIFRARNEIANDFILAHWQTMTDADMAKVLGYGELLQVCQIRRQLGLNRSSLRRKLPDDFNPEELVKAITEAGLTLTQFAKQRGLKVSLERLSQIAEKCGVNPITDRKPLWYAMRLGKPELGDKSRVQTLLDEKKNANAAAAVVGIEAEQFRRICRAHGIEIEKRRSEMIALVCSQCGTTFRRPKRLVEHDEKLYPDRTLHFCSRVCQGRRLGILHWIGEVSG